MRTIVALGIAGVLAGSRRGPNCPYDQGYWRTTSAGTTSARCGRSQITASP